MNSVRGSVNLTRRKRGVQVNIQSVYDTFVKKRGLSYYTPSKITLTAVTVDGETSNPVISGIVYKWYYTNSANELVYISSGRELMVDVDTNWEQRVFTVTITAPSIEGTPYDIRTLYREVEPRDGEEGYSVSLSKSEHTFNYDKNGNLKGLLSDGEVMVEVMKGSNALTCDSLGVLSPTNDNTYRVTSITQSPTRSISYNVDMPNYVFRLIPVDMTVDEVEITFTIVARSDGNNTTFTRKIRYQKHRDGADGADGLPPEIDTTITQYALGESKTEHPAEEGQVWAPSRIIDGQTFPAGYIDIWQDNRKHLIPNEATPYEWSRQKITYKNSTQVIYVGYVLITNISPMTYFFGEWDCRVKYTRSEKSYPIVTYLKGTGNKPLHYYPKNEGVIEYIWFIKPNVDDPSTWYKKNDLVLYENDGSNGDPVCPLGIFKSKYDNKKYLPSVSSWWENVTAKYAPNGIEGQKLWEFADGVELIITEALMANFAKLDSFVFNKGKMFSQQGNMGDYTDEGFIPNFEIDGVTGKMKALDVEIEGNITATSGSFTGHIEADSGTIKNVTITDASIGKWNIVDGSLYSDYDVGASIAVEQTGGRFLRINDSSDIAMLSIRADSDIALRIYTQSSAGVGISISAQTGGRAITSYGSHEFYQRPSEAWNAPGTLMALTLELRRMTQVGYSTNIFEHKWHISTLNEPIAKRESGDVIRLTHNLGHTDYTPHATLNAGGGEVDKIVSYSNYFDMYLAGSWSYSSHRIQITVIGRNRI